VLFGSAALTTPPMDRRFEEIFMRGVILHGPGDVSVEERERPQIVEPTDAIIRAHSQYRPGHTSIDCDPIDNPDDRGGRRDRDPDHRQ
jgi:hypothetical protein